MNERETAQKYIETINRDPRRDPKRTIQKENRIKIMP